MNPITQKQKQKQKLIHNGLPSFSHLQFNAFTQLRWKKSHMPKTTSSTLLAAYASILQQEVRVSSVVQEANAFYHLMKIVVSDILEIFSRYEISDRWYKIETLQVHCG
ncbi:uncharacterized protein LOC132799592 [Ziziphus jujuba]|uniref:Uncharacterized protein LOC132799592 n=1 Tax=Ziziphus jujuba TaxID=326968 RepID=A0ABM3ZTQ3_ZIZJJ|nr:uncharacterized protein LOC132799592 [Ziziphus jujuba]